MLQGALLKDLAAGFASEEEDGEGSDDGRSAGMQQHSRPERPQPGGGSMEQRGPPGQVHEYIERAWGDWDDGASSSPPARPPQTAPIVRQPRQPSAGPATPERPPPAAAGACTCTRPGRQGGGAG